MFREYPPRFLQPFSWFVPEGHTLHRLARDHSRWFAGQTLRVSSPQGRFAAGAEHLTGRRLIDVEAYGKHLFYRFEHVDVLHVHLGLYGKFRQHRRPLPEPRGAVRLRIEGDDQGCDLHGPTACELLDAKAREKLLYRLGPDPLRSDADPEKAWRRISSSRAAIGKLLLDQSVVAGVGNVYRAEVLFAAGMNPERQGRAVARAEFDFLWSTLSQWLRIGVKYNRIITTGEMGAGKRKRNERLMIYKKPHCPQCANEVSCWELGGRWMYACEWCQAD